MGPTAVGKTEASLLLARALNAEIVSVDSMQVYRGMDIGTAKPGIEDRRRVPHHMIDILMPTETFSAGRFREGALAAVEDIVRRGKRPLLVGGTGLYLRTLTRGLCGTPPSDPMVRKALERKARDEGAGVLYEQLRERDPRAAQRIEPGDVRRIVRALEVHEQTGRAFSDVQESTTVPAPFGVVTFVLSRERDDLYARINQRVDGMIEAGLVEEVLQLVRAFTLAPGPRQALGYKEIIGHLEGKHSLPEAVDLIKLRTRRYAKRQLTWFRAESQAIWVALSPEEAVDDTVRTIKERLAKL